MYACPLTLGRSAFENSLPVGLPLCFRKFSMWTQLPCLYAPEGSDVLECFVTTSMHTASSLQYTHATKRRGPYTQFPRQPAKSPRFVCIATCSRSPCTRRRNRPTLHPALRLLVQTHRFHGTHQSLSTIETFPTGKTEKSANDSQRTMECCDRTRRVQRPGNGEEAGR